MTQSMDTERADFEAVASDYGECPKAIERDAKGNYLLMHTATGWMWWKAARRAPAAPQAAPISDELPQGFISDVLTAAGLVRHGKQCKALADRLGDAIEKILTTSIAQRKAIAAAPQPPDAFQTADGFELWWADHMPNATQSDAWNAWVTLHYYTKSQD